jgi:hypothetical protein
LWRYWWNEDWQGKPKYSEKTCPSATLSTTNPTCLPDANPGRRGGKPATNRLSYGAAKNNFAFISILGRHSIRASSPDGSTSKQLTQPIVYSIIEIIVLILGTGSVQLAKCVQTTESQSFVTSLSGRGHYLDWSQLMAMDPSESSVQTLPHFRRNEERGRNSQLHGSPQLLIISVQVVSLTMKSMKSVRTGNRTVIERFNAIFQNISGDNP